MRPKSIVHAEKKAREAFGLFIREHRLKAGFNQVELSEKLKYQTSQFVSNWERGVASPPIAIAPILVKLLKIDSKKLEKHYLEIATTGIRETFKGI